MRPFAPALRPSAAALLVLLLVRTACCNGVYIPDRAIEKMPSIPVQRALITYRDGKETLMVESGVQTESPGVGWILPLPHAPTHIAKGEPGTLISASMSLRPEFVHDLHQPWTLPLGILAFLAIPLLALVLTRDPKARRERVIGWIAAEMILMCIWSTLLSSSLSRSFPPSANDVELLSSQRVGNYNVDILSAKSADDLQTWLQQNHLQDLSSQARTIIDDYIQRNWCFAVAKLDLTPGVTSTPHPLVFTFPAESPVFPMKLTALSGSATHVELIVAADQSAQADGFHLACSDRFATSGQEMSSPSRLTIAHPDAIKHLWDQCVVSRLQADLQPSMMTQDIAINLRPFTAYRDTFYTPHGRNEVIATILIWGLVPASVIMAAAFAGMRRPARTPVLATLAILLATGVAAVLFANSIQVRSDVHIQKLGRFAMFRVARDIRDALEKQAGTFYLDDPALGDKLIQALQASDDARLNDLQGGPRRWERSPGNLFLSEDGTIVLYDLDTRPQIIRSQLHPHHPAATTAPSTTAP